MILYIVHVNDEAIDSNLKDQLAPAAKNSNLEEEQFFE